MTNLDYTSNYKKTRQKQHFIVATLLTLIIISILFALQYGAIKINLSEILTNSFNYKILLELRLPRILTTLLVGASLAFAGVITQGLFRNPMADPALIGMSSGASLFAIAFIIFSQNTLTLTWFANWGLTLSAFTGSLIITVLSYTFSIRNGKSSISLLMLSGIAINALCGALIGLLFYLADDNVLRNITFWSMGSFSNSSYISVYFIGVSFFACALLLKNTSRYLNALIISEAYALSLGINIKLEQHKAIIGIALLVGVATAFVGPIAFIGLLAPHIMRLINGANHHYLMLNSMLYGALILIVADIFSRTLASPTEIPIGVITALLGAPYFMYLLYRQKLNNTI